MNPSKYMRKDYNVPCLDLAKKLLGKILVRKIGDTLLKGRIVETEAYLGNEDKASHSYNGRRTNACEPMYMDPGTAYVYMTYGIYFCFNISSQEPGSAVLLRSLHPIEGIEEMKKFRTSQRKGKSSKELKITELCNGPSKLCMAMNIRKDNCNKIDMSNSEELWIEDGMDFNFVTVTSSRIGISSVGVEWASKPFRFYIFNCPHVSKRDNKAEVELCNKKIENYSNSCDL